MAIMILLIIISVLLLGGIGYISNKGRKENDDR